jgi:hypothetical protein
MSESYEVVTSALADHARKLSDLATELNSAFTTSQVTIGGDAYGQTGAQFATALSDVASAGQDTLKTGIEALESAAKAMRATAEEYERQETTSKARFSD